MRQIYDLLSQGLVTVGSRLITIGTGTHANNAQGMTLAPSAIRQVAHQFAACWCLHYFFRSASRVTSFSSIDSASSFFRRAFSASSSYSRFASGTFMPPNLLRHR